MQIVSKVSRNKMIHILGLENVAYLADVESENDEW